MNVRESGMVSELKLPIYLDYQATTPLDPRVLDVMMPYFTEKFGNPHSTNHTFGWEAEAGVEKARKQVAHLISAHPDEIIFTSGATEANNIALKGLAYSRYPDKQHVITVATEHTCVLESCRALERAGFEVTYLPVNEDGLINLDYLKEAITDKTALISVMAVNNEIGVIQDLKAIGEICQAQDIVFHTDAAQAVGKIALNVNELKIDMMSISGHKIYGPKGIGALYLKKKDALHPLPLFDGGGQEEGMRSGTLAPALCAGLGMACQIAEKELIKDQEHVSGLFQKLTSSLLHHIPEMRINGSLNERYLGNLNLTFEGVKSDLIFRELRNIALSTGSACSTEKVEPSHVLTALGLDKKQIDCSVRLGFGRMTTSAEIDYALDQLIISVNKIRKML